MKKAVFFIKKESFRGLEGRTAERVLRQLIYEGDDGSLDLFNIGGETQLRINDICKYRGYDVFVFIYGKALITRESLNALVRIAVNREDFSVIAPVSNLCASSKIEAPPFFYQTITAFRWASKAVYEEFRDDVIEVEGIDGFCFTLSAGALDLLPKEAFLVDLPDIINSNDLRIGIAKGVYFHVYGDCYESNREDLMAHIPLDSTNVLDIGCANGLFGEMLKKRQRCIITGVDCDIELAEMAKKRLNNVINGDIQDIIDNGILGRFDCIVCGDVLEHLCDPWKTVKGLRRHLKERGILIASVPNIANWGVIYEMLKGRWDYVPFTILSGTHLRFFTRESIKECFEEVGYHIKDLYFQSFGIPPKGAEFIGLLKETMSDINEEELQASEIVIVAERG